MVAGNWLNKIGALNRLLAFGGSPVIGTYNYTKSSSPGSSLHLATAEEDCPTYDGFDPSWKSAVRIEHSCQNCEQILSKLFSWELLDRKCMSKIIRCEETNESVQETGAKIKSGLPWFVVPLGTGSFPSRFPSRCNSERNLLKLLHSYQIER
jgi:hypothetical protein